MTRLSPIRRVLLQCVASVSSDLSTYPLASSTKCMTDNTKSRAGPLRPFPASFAQAPAQRNKSDAWAKPLLN